MVGPSGACRLLTRCADADEVVTLDGSASTAPGGTPDLVWVRLSDGVVVGRGAIVKTRALGRVEEIIQLEATDAEGEQAFDTVSIFNHTLLDTAVLQERVAALVAVNQELQNRLRTVEARLASEPQPAP